MAAKILPSAGQEDGLAAGAGVAGDWPFRETIGRLDRFTVPNWLLSKIELPEPCCCEKPQIW